MGQMMLFVNMVKVEPSSWNLTIITTEADQDYSLGIYNTDTCDLDIDWGDGAGIINYTTNGTKTNTYTTPGEYIVEVSGALTGELACIANMPLTADLVYRTGAIGGVIGFDYYGGVFRYCSNLMTIPADIFRYNPGVSGRFVFDYTFFRCTGLTSIPENLFKYNTLVNEYAFLGTFSECSGITNIPENLFKYNTLVNEYAFYATFEQCDGVFEIPENLFKYNVLLSKYAFYETFLDCSGLTSIPENLFKYNTLVSEGAFIEAFNGCSSLLSIPDDLFKYNVLVSDYGFDITFQFCLELTTIPSGLFKYNTACTSWADCFNICPKLTLKSDIFYDDGEQSTRFAGKNVDFSNCFNISGDVFEGTQGTAPDLWNCTGTFTKTDCFDGHSTDSLTNYADIPTEWK